MPLAALAEVRGGGKLGLSGKDFVPDGFPAYGAGGLNGRLPVYEYDRPAVVLSSIGARCGKCFFVDGRWASLANTQVILPNPALVDARFLWHQLNDEARWPRSGTGQPFIKPSDVKAHEVWLPGLEEQHRIAAILDKVDQVRNAHAAVRRALDDLRAAVFKALLVAHEPLEYCRLGELCRPRQYRTIPRSEMVESGFPVFGANGQIGFAEEFTHTQPVILVGCRGSCGTIHVTPPRIYATGNAMALDDLDRSKVEPVFLAEWLRLRGFGDVTTGSSQPQITGQNLRRVEVPVVPLTAQRTVVMQLSQASKFGELNRRVEEYLAELEKALRDQAFKDEL